MKQEPVKCTCGYSIGHPLVSKCICTPRKEWVGLTEEDRKNFYQGKYVISDDDLMDAVEAKLREKNHVS